MTKKDESISANAEHTMGAFSHTYGGKPFKNSMQPIGGKAIWPVEFLQNISLVD